MTWHSEWHGEWHHDWHGIASSEFFDGYGEDPVATFALDLENGYTVVYSWVTGIIKTASGIEQRSSRNPVAKQSFDGRAVLLGNMPRKVRAKMAEFAATGSVFGLALPHEEAALSDDAAGAVVPLDGLDACDWAVIGQRVAVVLDDDSVEAVIQDVTADDITLDVAPGAVGVYGATVRPILQVLLEPQQPFPRFPTDAELWSLKARAAELDFAPTLASIPLSSLSAPFDNAVATVRRFGLITIGLELLDTGTGSGQLSETSALTTFRYEPDVTTLGDFATALEGSANFLLTGTYNPADTFSSGDDLFAVADGATEGGQVGIGAVLATYDSRPVWDRPLDIDALAEDGVHGMTVIVDNQGRPYAIGTADQPDWYRHVGILDGDRDDWQWFKKFMTEVRGSTESWWLPTWRHDMTFISKAANTITVSTEDESDVLTWWPKHRQHIQIEETDGTITYAEITAIVDNGDGTATLTIGVTLASSSVEMVSWLELCRFERDEFSVRFDQAGFTV